jgi:holo-[acyl-carrier protein] synthase
LIFGIGTDIIRVERMEKLVAGGRQYLETIFTEKEMDYCETKARKSEHYAARYAAKEAFLKALGKGYRDGFAFSEIEINNDELGKPQVFLYGEVNKYYCKLEIRRISISLSHIEDIATAVVILETD